MQFEVFFHWVTSDLRLNGWWILADPMTKGALMSRKIGFEKGQAFMLPGNSPG